MPYHPSILCTCFQINPGNSRRMSTPVLASLFFLAIDDTFLIVDIRIYYYCTLFRHQVVQSFHGIEILFDHLLNDQPNRLYHICGTHDLAAGVEIDFLGLGRIHVPPHNRF